MAVHPGLPVLMYHGLASVPGGPLRPLAVPPPRLREHLRALGDAGYQLDREVRDSTHALQDAVAGPIRSFAYPHGYHSARVRATVTKYGHDNACEVGRRAYRPGSNRLAISRYKPTPDHDGEALLRMVRGGEPSLIPRLKRRAQPGWRLTRGVALRAFNRRLT